MASAAAAAAVGGCPATLIPKDAKRQSDAKFAVPFLANLVEICRNIFDANKGGDRKILAAAAAAAEVLTNLTMDNLAKPPKYDKPHLVSSYLGDLKTVCRHTGRVSQLIGQINDPTLSAAYKDLQDCVIPPAQ